MSGRRTFTLLFVGILLIQAAWIAAMPAFRGPDEFDHVFRAEGVSHGAFMPGNDWPEAGRGSLTPARTSVIESASEVCSWYRYTEYYNCHPSEDRRDTWNQVLSGAARYNPSYYLAVGTVGRFFDGVAVDYAIRVTTALICALMVAWAGTIWVRVGTSRWITLGFLVALTPVFLFSTAIAAPNGVSYSAGLLAWVAGLSMIRSRSRPRNSELAAVAVGTIVLCNTHTTGPLWVLLIALALVALAPARALELARERRVRPWAVLIGLGGVASVVWTLLSGANIAKTATVFDHGPDPVSFAQNQVVWLLQTIAAFPLRDEFAPPSVYGLWLVPFVAMIWLAFRVRGRVPVVAALVGVASIVVSVTLTLLTYRTQGFAWQGRYGLPLVIGMVLIPATFAVRQPVRAFFDCAVGCMVVASAISVGNLAHSQRGFLARPLTVHLPAGPVLVALLAAAGTLVLAMVLNRSLPPDAPDLVKESL